MLAAIVLVIKDLNSVFYDQEGLFCDIYSLSK